MSALCREFGLSNRPVVRMLKEAGVWQPGHRERYSAAQKAEIAERYVSGETIEYLASAFGCSTGTIWAVLKREGIQTREPHKRRYADESLYEDVRRRHANGETSRHIATELNARIEDVYRWLRQMGLKPVQTIGNGPRANGWKGGRTNAPGGYMAAWVDEGDPMRVMAWGTGYVPEHRLVMARSLGRPLRPTETVHHINGDKRDNRLENLQLRQGRHGKGVKLTCLDCGSHNVEPVSL